MIKNRHRVEFIPFDPSLVMRFAVHVRDKTVAFGAPMARSLYDAVKHLCMTSLASVPVHCYMDCGSAAEKTLQWSYLKPQSFYSRGCTPTSFHPACVYLHNLHPTIITLLYPNAEQACMDVKIGTAGIESQDVTPLSGFFCHMCTLQRSHVAGRAAWQSEPHALSSRISAPVVAVRHLAVTKSHPLSPHCVNWPLKALLLHGHKPGTRAVRIA